MTEKHIEFLLRVLVAACNILPGVDKKVISAALFKVASEIEETARELEK